jgi:hypothetical protein
MISLGRRKRKESIKKSCNSFEGIKVNNDNVGRLELQRNLIIPFGFSM